MMIFCACRRATTPKSGNAAFELMRRFNRESGTAFLIVTHDPRIAGRCDRVVELVDGRIAADGAPARPAGAGDAQSGVQR